MTEDSHIKRYTFRHLPLTPGTRLGVFQLADLIGRGGMGEVYRARDTKLDRDVAIKFLPHSLAADPERLARFEREAAQVVGARATRLVVTRGITRPGSVNTCAVDS